MKTKLILMSCCMTLLVLVSRSQTPATSHIGGTTFGIRAGANFQNINGKNYSGNSLENKLKTGFHVGANAEIPVAKDFFVQPGILFSTKGAILDSSESRFNLSYVEIPVNFLYKPILGNGKMLLGFGPYVGFAVGGKLKPKNGNDQDIKFQSSVSDAELLSGPYAKRLDAGANFLAGYELSSKFSLQLNAQLGLVKINPKYESIPNDKSSSKNTGFGLSAGYRF